MLAEMITQVGSLIGGLVMAYAMLRNYFPYELRRPFQHYFEKIFNFFSPYIHITFDEYQSNGFERNIGYAATKRYLNAHSANQAKRLLCSVVRDTEAVVFTMANNEEVMDEFKGIKLWWASGETMPAMHTITMGPREAKKRYFSLTFHKRYRDVICNDYVKHVMEQGKAIAVKERRRKLFTNNNGGGGGWAEVVFDHPATFHTLGMDPVKKQEIIDDLINFSESKDYYKSVGKVWKRGYLLHGPPGTGKSTMIAAMANLLEYDVYDLELTAVNNNTELRKLLMDISGKSIIVIEDIDCSLDLTGQREKKNEDEENGDKKKDEEKEKKPSTVTLSGVLNFIDGLCSACGGERIFVFTTNHVEKLDPALIRRGRMDKHIKLRYCGFEAFKVFTKNYLDIEYHDSFDTIRQLLEETNISPADVAEILMPKLRGEKKERSLERLMKALEETKKEDEKKAEKLAKEEVGKNKRAAEEEEEKKGEEKENGAAEKSSTNGVKENGVVADVAT